MFFEKLKNCQIFFPVAHLTCLLTYLDFLFILTFIQDGIIPVKSSWIIMVTIPLQSYLRKTCMVASIYLTVVLAHERYLAIRSPIQVNLDISRNGSYLKRHFAIKKYWKKTDK